MEAESPEALSRALSKDSRLVRELQSRHSSLISSRSSCIRQLREINSSLRQFVGKITELKAARDRETAAVRELKAKRQEANDAIRANGPEMRQALDAKEAAIGSLSKTKGNAGRKSAGQLYSEMEALEMRIITEALPFSEEQRLMKVIREKRKQLEAVKAFSEAMKSHRELFTKFSELRRQSYAFHTELQKHAAESQKFHEEMMAAVGKVKELRQRKNSILGQLDNVKGEFAAVDSSLKDKLHEVSGAREKLDAITAERHRKAVEETEQKLTEMLKSGKKLTAKDLIALREDK